MAADLPHWVVLIPAGVADDHVETLALDMARIYGATHYARYDTTDLGPDHAFVLDTHITGILPHWIDFFALHPPQPLPAGEWQCPRCGEPLAHHPYATVGGVTQRQCLSTLRKALTKARSRR